MDLLDRHGSQCKQSDTNSEKFPVLILGEYRMTGKGSQPIRFEIQNKLLYKIKYTTAEKKYLLNAIILSL